MTRALLERCMRYVGCSIVYNMNDSDEKSLLLEAILAELAKPAQQERKPDAYIRKDQLEKAKVSAMLCEVTHEPRADRIAIYTSPVAQQERRPHTEAEVHRILYFVHVDFLKEAEEKVRAILGVPAP